VIDAAGFASDTLCGIELDSGCIADAHACAGITPRDARQYIDFATTYGKPAYLHISDSVEYNPAADNGKLLAHLLADFVKALGV